MDVSGLEIQDLTVVVCYLAGGRREKPRLSEPKSLPVWKASASSCIYSALHLKASLKMNGGAVRVKDGNGASVPGTQRRSLWLVLLL